MRYDCGLEADVAGPDCECGDEGEVVGQFIVGLVLLVEGEDDAMVHLHERFL